MPEWNHYKGIWVNPTQTPYYDLGWVYIPSKWHQNKKTVNYLMISKLYASNHATRNSALSNDIMVCPHLYRLPAMVPSNTLMTTVSWQLPSNATIVCKWLGFCKRINTTHIKNSKQKHVAFIELKSLLHNYMEYIKYMPNTWHEYMEDVYTYRYLI